MQNRRAFIAAILCASLTRALPSFATDATWDGGTGNWTQSAHWGFATGFPNNSTKNNLFYDVFIGGGTVSSGSFTVDSLSFGSATLNAVRLTLNNGLTLGWNGASAGSILAGTITLKPSATATLGAASPYDLTFTDSTLTNNGTFTLASGSITGGTLTSGGLMTFQVGSPIALTGNIITNSGSMLFQAGSAVTVSNGTLTNTGSIEIDDASTISFSNERLANSGTLILSNVSDAVFPNSFLSNAGYLQINSGSLSLLTNDGSLVLGAGTSVTFSEAVAGVVSGAGNVRITADGIIGDYNVTGLTTLARGPYYSLGIAKNVTFGDADIQTSISGTGTVTVNGNCTLVGSVGVNGGLTINGTLTMPSTFGVSTTLTLAAGHTASWGGPGFASGLIGEGGSLINHGTFTFLGGELTGDPNAPPHAPAAFLLNTGTLLVNAPTGVTISDSNGSNGPSNSPLYFQNQGLVKVCAGTLELDVPDSGPTAGAFDVHTGATLILGSAYTFTSSARVTGGGELTVRQPVLFAGAVNFPGTFNGSNTTFSSVSTLKNAALSGVAGAGTLTITGQGSISTSSSISSLQIEGNTAIQGPFTFDGSAITVAPGGSLTLDKVYTSTFKNQASITNNGVLTALSSNVLEGPITNNGTITISPGSSAFEIGSAGTFNNNGTVNVNFGLAYLGGAGADSAAALVHVFPHAMLLLGGPRSFGGALINEGVMVASANGAAFGADLKFENEGLLDAFGGIIVLAAAQDPLTTGTFNLGANGSIQFAADYDFSTSPTLTGSGTVTIDPGVTLTISDDATFTGTIIDNGTLLITGPRFSDTPPATPSFTVTGANAPEPAALALLAAGALPLLSRRRRR